MEVDFDLLKFALHGHQAATVRVRLVGEHRGGVKLRQVTEYRGLYFLVRETAVVRVRPAGDGTDAEEARVGPARRQGVPERELVAVAGVVGQADEKVVGGLAPAALREPS